MFFVFKGISNIVKSIGNSNFCIKNSKKKKKKKKNGNSHVIVQIAIKMFGNSHVFLTFVTKKINEYL